MTNHYEERQQARKESLEQKAGKARKDSGQAYQAARQAVEAIPMGQPILVGHHSEGRHRAALRRHDGNMRKAIESDDKASYYERKAAGVGTGGVSGDDPAAINKLTAELEALQASQLVMKQANAIIRSKAKTIEQKNTALIALGFSAEQAASIQKPDHCQRIGFASYALTNNNSNIRRVEARIEELMALAARPVQVIQGAGYFYRECQEENRIIFTFDEKPDEETRKKMKAEAFKWSPSREGKPYVRKITGNALAAARYLREWLEKKAANSEQLTTKIG
jgi:prefoldin subunit 5